MKIIGVMTGNSLDAADAVLTEFSEKNIRDIAAFSTDFPVELTKDLLTLRAAVKGRPAADFENDVFFTDTLARYTETVAQAVNALDKTDVVAVGFHGQTCDHFPPSVAGREKPYTLQIFDAQKLADLTGLPVIYDFRSDDVLNGGEGAPLIPAHNAHLSESLPFETVAFCNAGNTGNIAVMSGSSVVGWDVGPFNHFADRLVRENTGDRCDKDGLYGRTGRIDAAYLKTLFDSAAKTADGGNFFLKEPPRSSDPSWYVLPESDLPFPDKLRTVEYLSAYAYFHALSFVKVPLPEAFLTFGGGWNNPLPTEDFRNLLNGKGIVLPEHERLFSDILARFKKPPVLAPADDYGINGKYMEARLCADLAYSKIVGRPFTFPETTGVRAPTVAGIWCLPKTGKHYPIEDLLGRPDAWDKKYCRAAKR